jgi:GGDEF domain-containing protein
MISLDVMIGEEFFLILNSCNTQFAEARAEEIRKAVCAQPVQTSSGPLRSP